MDNIVIKKTWLQNRPVAIDLLQGNTFTGESGAHTFEISGMDDERNAVAISGTITGKFFAPNNVTIPLTGAAADGVASLTLSENCYAAPGRFTLTIYAEDSGQKVCIYCGVGNVYRTQSDVVEYPSALIPDVEDLIEQLQEILDGWPADYSQIESDVSDLKSAVSHADNTIITGENLIFDMKWEYGNINSSGEDANSTRVYYARTKGYYTPQANCYFNPVCKTSDNMTFIIAEYNSDGTFSKRDVYAFYLPAEAVHLVDYPLTAGKKYRFSFTLPNTVTIDLTHIENYAVLAVKSVFADMLDGLKQAKSITGSDRVTVSQSSLTSGTALEITAMPLYLKKNHGYTFSAIFSSFTKLIIGQGYQTYRGKWFEIDGTNIVVKQYDAEETIVGTIAHGLTLYGQINCSMMIDDAGKGHFVITTLPSEGVETCLFSHEFNMGYEVNGNYYVKGSQNLANVTFSAISGDIRKPLWIFGDSYLGIYDERVGGQLKNFGYINNIMIHALAGQNSADAYTELQKALALGTPKYLLWTLGMNDSSADNYSTVMNNVKNLCEAKNITLILYRVPTVPSRKSICEGINTAMLATGLRYINAYRAVETNADGEWADGLLAVDGVHPTEMGAQVIAQRYLVDVPEIMEYMV